MLCFYALAQDAIEQAYGACCAMEAEQKRVQCSPAKNPRRLASLIDLVDSPACDKKNFNETSLAQSFAALSVNAETPERAPKRIDDLDSAEKDSHPRRSSKRPVAFPRVWKDGDGNVRIGKRLRFAAKFVKLTSLQKVPAQSFSGEVPGPNVAAVQPIPLATEASSSAKPAALSADELAEEAKGIILLQALNCL